MSLLYFDFIKALELLKEGKKVARCSWEQKMFINLNGNKTRIIETQIKDSYTLTCPYNPIQRDLLADDWFEVV